MDIVETQAKKCGNTLGLKLPLQIVQKEHIHEDPKIHFLILKDSTKTFGNEKTNRRFCFTLEP